MKEMWEERDKKKRNKKMIIKKYKSGGNDVKREKKYT